MITYDDIKKILESVDIAKLEKDYMTRQEVNLLDNTMKAKDVLAYFPDELIYLPKGLEFVNNNIVSICIKFFIVLCFYQIKISSILQFFLF